MNSGQKAPLALTPEELRALLEVTLSHNDREAYVMWLIGVAHGLRVSGLIELRRRDFEESANGIQLTVQRLKNSNRTTQELLSAPNPLLDELTVVREWIKDLKPNDRLFNLGDRFAVGGDSRNTRNSPGVDSKTPHPCSEAYDWYLASKERGGYRRYPAGSSERAAALRRFVFWMVIVIGVVGLCGTIILKLLGR